MQSVNNPEMLPSLKEQIIEAMWKSPEAFLSKALAERLFNEAVWPVLEKSIEAGNLLLSRNTKEQLPVATAITEWLKVTVWFCKRVRADEATISRRELLKIIGQFEEQITKALADAESVSSVCPICNSNRYEAAQRHEGPHATWCPKFREDQRGGSDDDRVNYPVVTS